METSELVYNLTGKTLLVTGADGRLGYEVSLAAARSGARVIASTRTEEKAAANKQQLEKDLGGTGGAVETLVMDLSSFASVRGAAAEVSERFSSLDGVLQVAHGGPDAVTDDGFVGTLQINVLSPALLTELLLPQLSAAPAPRAVYIGSMASFADMHWDRKDPVGTLMRQTRGEEEFRTSSYGLSKFLDVHYAAEQAKRSPNLTVFSVQPGYFRDPPSAYQCPTDIVKFTPCPQSPAQGATSTFFAAGQPGIEDYSGAMFDFETTNGTQIGETCIPRDLPTWDPDLRSQWYDEVQALIEGAAAVSV
jgi:NAD(P)-dependent dehydrogenase (short-subunit alcohol dehydrogenase family)